MADLLCDAAITLDNCPACGEEIRWEHPRSRVRGIVWHKGCLEHSRARHRSGERMSAAEAGERLRRMSEQAQQSTSDSIHAFVDKMDELWKRRDNLEKMRRGRR